MDLTTTMSSVSPSVETDINMRREATLINIDMNLEKEQSQTDGDTRMFSLAESAMSFGDNCENLERDVTMRREDTVYLKDDHMSFCRRSTRLAQRMDMENVGRTETQMSLGKDLSYQQTQNNVSVMPSSSMNMSLTGHTTQIHTDIEMNIKKEILDTDISSNSNSSFFGSQFDDDDDEFSVHAERSTNGEMSQILPVANVKQEPSEFYSGNLITKEDAPKSRKKKRISEEGESSEVSNKKQKMVVKLKKKFGMRPNFRYTEKKKKWARSNLAMDCEQDNSTALDSEIIIKCEPTSENEMDVDFNHMSEQPQTSSKGEKPCKPRKRNPRKKPPALCSHCHRIFCSHSSLKRHYKRKHSNHEVPLKCKICNITFYQYLDLRAHERTHKGQEKTFPCQECDVVFTRACHLKVHMRKHTGERPYSCVHCNATFRSTSNLNRHAAKHSGLRPYVCTVCNADFYQSSHLVSHVRKHTGERPFSCSQCNATFTQPTHLYRHKTKHTGKKPYPCDQCEAGFVEKSALKKHLEIHARKTTASATDSGHQFKR